MDILTLLEWTGSALAVVGALLMANRHPVWGYSLMSLSCPPLILVLALGGQYGVVAMQSIFLAINVNGLVSWTAHHRQNRLSLRGSPNA